MLGTPEPLKPFKKPGRRPSLPEAGRWRPPTAMRTAQLAELGVARISYGPLPYLRMMSALRAASIEALALQAFQ